MNYTEAATKACEQPTFLIALSWMALWECERAIQQALQNEKEGTKNPDGSKWDTCFTVCFQEVSKQWNKLHATMTTNKVLEDIRKERIRQIKKWGIQKHDYPQWLTILLEEVGESSKAYLEHGNLHEELVHVAAVAVAMVESFEDRENG